MKLSAMGCVLFRQVVNGRRKKLLHRLNGFPNLGFDFF
jgi:hypothetical protein